MSLNLPSNPGVGLQLTGPRIQEHLSSPSISGPSPGPQSYSINGTMDLTERQKNQNLLLSRRYEGKNFSSPIPPLGAAATQGPPPPSHPAEGNVCSAPVASPSAPQTPSAPSSLGKKRSREPDAGLPAEYYDLPGMADRTDQEWNRDEILCKRYHMKE
ncbi:hypothetical protein ACHAWF_009655 [Thalassiosira exigua]